MKRRVFCTFQFEGFHRWPDAFGDHLFLAQLHRHMFHVRIEVPVTHNDRDVEFVSLRRDAERWCRTRAASSETHTWSCETWCKQLLTQFKAARVEVSEDGENGAILEICQ